MSVRAQRLADRLPEIGADVIVVTSLINVRYLTGFTGSNGLVLVGPDIRAFITDFRYVEQSAAEVDIAFDRRTSQTDLVEAIADLLPTGSVRLAFEDSHLTVRSHAKLRELMPERVELVAAGDPVEQLRAVKDAEEIRRIAAATELADAALRTIMEHGLVGRTERQVATALERTMQDLGAEGPSFDSIIAAGPHGALPHATPTDVEITPGQLVVVDWGAGLDGYFSDCTRTLATGELDEAAQIVYDIVHQAQLAGLDAVLPGAGGREVDGAARAVIADAGHGEHFGHGLGHGVGMEVHEAPRLSQRSDSVLADGNVVTVEPGIYLPGQFGVRIEDLVVVTESGRQILTSIPKELITVS
ncbi:MAG: Xaa-Pro peptidase family protein [Solirubrobacteraceae bacterium]